MTKIIFDGKRHCAYCGGSGLVAVPATTFEAPTEEPCAVCAGTGLCEQARIAKLEATVKLLQRAVRKVYQDVPEMWEEAV